MSLVAQRIRAVRDARVAAHQAAIDARDVGKLFAALVETSATVANVLIGQYGGTYDRERTFKYLQNMARFQLGYGPLKAAPEPTNDGAGSATAAAGFGVQEFVNQDNRQWQLVWHHNSGSNARDSHADADGTIVDATTGFDVDPGLGAPGCMCDIEPINPSGGLIAPTEMTLRELEAAARAYKAAATEAKYGGRWYRNALRGFQEHSWDLQAALREGRKLTGMEKIGGLPANSRVRWLDEAISKGQFADDTVLYRGGLFRDMKVGDTFTDAAYGSTSVSETIARGFVPQGGKLLEIHVAAGQNAAFLGGQFAKQSLGEVLLPRGMQYTVKEVVGDRIVLEVGNVVPKVAERVAVQTAKVAGELREFKTVREAQDWINATIESVGGGARTDLLRYMTKNGALRASDMTVDMANRIAQTVDMLVKKAPEMLKALNGFRIEDNFGHSTYAWVRGGQFGDHMITLEYKSWCKEFVDDLAISPDQLERRLINDAVNGYHPATGIDSVITHELGHIYFGTYETSAVSQLMAEVYGEFVKEGFDQYVLDTVANPTSVAKWVSRYAEKNFAEFIAEVTAAVITGEGERYVSHLAGKEFIKIMRRLWRERGWIK